MKHKTPVLIVLIFLTTSVSAAEVKVTTQKDWNQGTFTGTSADRNDNSGNLGLGYKNGTSSDSLVGYWRLDRSVSGTGGTVKDYSGNAIDGLYVNGVTTGAQGVFGTNGIDLSSSSDTMKSDHYLGLSGNSPHTMIVWFKGSTTDGGALVSVNYNNNPHKGVDFWNQGSGEFCQHIINSWSGDALKQCTDSSASDFQSAFDGNWHMLVATYDGSKNADGIDLYIDGEKQPEYTQENTLTSDDVSADSYPVRIGSRNDDAKNPDQINPGRYDEFRVYDRELSSLEIKKLYLRVKPLKGNYSKSIDNLEETKWNELEVDTSSIPTDTDVDAVFRAKDSSDNVIDSQVFDLQEGQTNYSLDVSDSEKAEIVFNGSSNDVTKSWRIDGFKVFAGFCDYRSTNGKCVMKSTRQLEPETYDIDSIFESRITAVFEAFSGNSVLNISNSSRLSGTWKGSFDIRSTPVTIEPGASFKPEKGRIIIGK